MNLSPWPYLPRENCSYFSVLLLSFIIYVITIHIHMYKHDILLFLHFYINGIYMYISSTLLFTKYCFFIFIHAIKYNLPHFVKVIQFFYFFLVYNFLYFQIMTKFLQRTLSLFLSLCTYIYLEFVHLDCNC